MQVVTESELRGVMGPQGALEAVELAFTKLAEGKVEQPPVMQIMFPARDGEVCVKAAHLRGQPLYAVKVAGGFNKNAEEGLPTGSGLMLVMSAVSGAPVALLQDNGWLTDLRTAAAGALAAKYLTPTAEPVQVGIIGTGIQARMQLEAISNIRKISSVTIWSRSEANREAYCKAASEKYDFPVTSSDTPVGAVKGADVVVTTTPSKTAIVMVDDLKPSATVIAVGSDTPGKQEVDTNVIDAIIASKGKIIGDKKTQVVRLGELQHTPHAHDAIVELGDIVVGKAKGRQGDEMILCDLTGVGVQDAAIAEAAYNAIKRGTKRSSPGV